MNAGKHILLLGALLLGVLAGALILVGRSAAGNGGEPLMLYCAASVKPAMRPLAEAYERAHGQRVQLMYGGSGTLLSNLEVSGQGDLYLAADHAFMARAVEKGLVIETFILAWQQPVLVVRKGNPKHLTSLEDLGRADVRVALGNPAVASIGQQSKALLERVGHWDLVKAAVVDRGVFKPTVTEVTNDVKLGAVDAGLVWDSALAHYPELEAVRLPLFMDFREPVSVGVVAGSTRSADARRLARYLQSEVGRAVFAAQGFEVAEGPPQSP